MALPALPPEIYGPVAGVLGTVISILYRRTTVLSEQRVIEQKEMLVANHTVATALRDLADRMERHFHRSAHVPTDTPRHRPSGDQLDVDR